MMCECMWRATCESGSPPYQLPYAVVLVALITGAALRCVLRPRALVGLNQVVFCAAVFSYVTICASTSGEGPDALHRWLEAMLHGAIAVTACVYAELISGLLRRRRPALPPARLC
jgi:hypothetical protein